MHAATYIDEAIARRMADDVTIGADATAPIDGDWRCYICPTYSTSKYVWIFPVGTGTGRK